MSWSHFPEFLFFLFEKGTCLPLSFLLLLRTGGKEEGIMRPGGKWGTTSPRLVPFDPRHTQCRSVLDSDTDR